MNPIEYLWDALKRSVTHHIPAPIACLEHVVLVERTQEHSQRNKPELNQQYAQMNRSSDWS